MEELLLNSVPNVRKDIKQPKDRIKDQGDRKKKEKPCDEDIKTVSFENKLDFFFGFSYTIVDTEKINCKFLWL